MKPLLWWLRLFVAPAVLIAIELFHPAGFTTSPGMYQFAVSVLAASALLLSSRASWPNMVPLLGFGWELQTAHASSHGPIAFALLIVAAAGLWWARLRVAPVGPA